jgi:hypothetical protein
MRRRKKTRAGGHIGRSPASNSSLRAGAGASAADCKNNVSGGWLHMTLSAELLADAHPGSGAGGGGIDALVARDRRGLPVIWASHIEGVLRDAGRRLRGEAIAGDFFGRAGGQQQRVIFTSLYTASAPVTRIWRSTARTAFDNRAPQDDTLRVVEHVPKGTRFEGRVQILASDLPLLRRLLVEADALGRGRPTGAGRVKLSLTETAVSAHSVGSTNSRLVLLLRNLDPLCITGTATPNNVIRSLAYVPGRAVLGALANWLIGDGYRDAAALLVGGRTAVSDALPLPFAPEILVTAEVLPAPLSLLSKPAGTTGPIPWWAQAPTPLQRFDSLHLTKNQLGLKRPDDDLFVYRDGPAHPWIVFRPQLRERLRNGRPDPEQPEPALFAIEQIVEDTLFLCEIRGDASDLGQLAPALKPVLEGRHWVRVGRAGAPVEVVRLAWSGEPSSVEESSRAILTLTSDLLMRDECLRWCTSLDEARLRQLPGWPADVHVSRTVQDTVAVHGFNGTSRLWRMPAYGVRRGSVLELEGEGVAELARMMAQGRWLGERTHEGFGRFRLDDTLPGVSGDTIAMAADNVTAADEPEEAVAETTRQWFEQHRALVRVGGSSDRRPSLSQWLDLVSDLEREDADALGSRQNPTTAGRRSWTDADAREILEKLAAMRTASDRKSHARLFVRRLRAEMRRENR